MKYEIGIQNHEYGFMTVETDLEPESDEFNELIQEKFNKGDYNINKNYMEWDISGFTPRQKIERSKNDTKI